MSYPTAPFIQGEFLWRDSGKISPLTNPATEDVFCEVTICSAAQTASAIESADAAYRQTWRDLTPGKRTEILFKIAQQLRADAEKIARIESENIGKPISDARDEAQLGARIFEYYA